MKRRLEELERALLASCRRRYGNRLVSLAVFGSWARVTATPESDIDVLVVAMELPAGRMKRVAEFEAVEEETAGVRRAIWPGQKTATALSPVLKTPAEVGEGSPLFLDMTVECTILQDKEGFLAGYLEALRARMAKLGSTRKSAKGGYYWVYKPDIRPGEVVAL